MKDSISRRNFITKCATGVRALRIGPMQSAYLGVENIQINLEITRIHN